MRRVYFFMLISANGFYERGPWELDWHSVDEEFNEFAIAQLDSVGTLLFGRATYEGMAAYWTTADAIASDPEVAGRMNSIEKIVFSKSLTEARWSNTRLVGGNAVEEVSALRSREGRDMLVMGSSDLAASLAEHGLIDEFRILVVPIVLPRGKPLFAGATRDLRMRLVSTRSFANGNVLLTYGPSRDDTA